MFLTGEDNMSLMSHSNGRTPGNFPLCGKVGTFSHWTLRSEQKMNGPI